MTSTHAHMIFLSVFVVYKKPIEQNFENIYSRQEYENLGIYFAPVNIKGG